jgi:hypothetical protein
LYFFATLGWANMGGKIAIAVAAITILTTGCREQTQAAKVDAAYVNRMTTRLAEYSAQASQLDGAIQQDAKQIPSDTAKAQVMVDIKADAEIHARFATLSLFMHDAAASGQFGLMTSWLQGEVSDLQRSSQKTDAKANELRTTISQAQSVPDLGAKLVDLAGSRGWEQGTAEELVTIAGDVAGYEKDYSGAAGVDEQRRREAAQALAAYLSAPRVEITEPTVMPAIPMLRPPTYTNCMSTLMGMNCMTQ